MLAGGAVGHECHTLTGARWAKTKKTNLDVAMSRWAVDRDVDVTPGMGAAAGGGREFRALRRAGHRCGARSINLLQEPDQVTAGDAELQRRAAAVAAVAGQRGEDLLALQEVHLAPEPARREGLGRR